MSTRIWKYQLRYEDEQEVHLPQGSRLLHVGHQHGALCLWVMADPTAPTYPARFFVVGTGRDIPYNPYRLWHMGTVQVGEYVWHVFMDAVPLQETRAAVMR